MKKYSIFILIAGMLTLAACSDYHRDPGTTYAPDMTYSRAVDYYHSTDKITEAGGSYNKMPVGGTVAREQALPDHIAENDSALAKLNMPKMELTDKDVEKGRRLYMIHCGICHGDKLDGQGPLYTSGKFAAMPANLKDPKFLAFTPGQIYHAIVYGKNMMGSYASQLDTRQRWQVVAYIKKIQAENGGTANGLVAGTKPGNDSLAAAKNTTPATATTEVKPMEKESKK